MRATPLLLAIAAAALSAGQQQIWSGHTGGVAVEWSAKNIRAYEVGSKALNFDLYSYLNADFRRLSRPPHDSYLKCEHDVDLKSAVGNYLSISDVADLDFHGPHEEVTAIFRTFDLNRSKAGKAFLIKLTDLFPEDAIYQALLQEKTLSQVLTQGSKPSDLAGLLKVLDGQDVTEDGKLLSITDQVTLAQSVKGGPRRYHFTADSPNRFAIYDYADGVATIHLCLDSGWHGDTRELAIKLAVPERLRASFESARLRKSGFLMKDRALIAPQDAITLIAFSER